MNNYTFAGKRVVVTGGASGVGAALVSLLHTLGSPEVIVLDVQEPVQLAKTQRWIPTDLTDPSALERVVSEIGVVDVLFNNAGVAGTARAHTIFSVNTLALRYLTDAIGSQMNPGGSVVNTASTAGLQWSKRTHEIDDLLSISSWDEALGWFDRRADGIGIDPYSFSKECVVRLTQRRAVPFAARGLRINSVCPSPIDTPLLNDFRTTFSDKVMDFSIAASSGLATPADIADVLAFFGMDASRQVNGVSMLADRGSTAGFATGMIDTSVLHQ